MANVESIHSSYPQITTATVGDLVRIKINGSTSRAVGFATVGVTGCAAFDGNPAENNANYSFSLIGSNGYDLKAYCARFPGQVPGPGSWAGLSGQVPGPGSRAGLSGRAFRMGLAPKLGFQGWLPCFDPRLSSHRMGSRDGLREWATRLGYQDGLPEWALRIS